MELSFFLFWFIPFFSVLLILNIKFYKFIFSKQRKFSDQLEYSIWKINNSLNQEKKNVPK